MKDPAILWYFNDWGGGTRTLTRHMKGCYIDLLEAQFNSGHLSLEEIRTVLGQDQANWTILSKKFKHDENGLFYNERLDNEIKKRKDFSEKQKKRIQDYWDRKKGKNEEKNIPRNNHGNTVEVPYENENRNRNENRNIEKGVQGEKQKSLHTQCKNLFAEKYHQLFDNKPYLIAKDSKAMNSIINKLEFSMKNKNIEITDESILNSWRLLLNSINDKWILEHFSLTIIDSKFNEIISAIKANKLNLQKNKQDYSGLKNKITATLLGNGQ